MNIRTLGLSAVLVLCLSGGSLLFSDFIVWGDNFDGAAEAWTTWNAQGFYDDDDVWVPAVYQTNWELGDPDYSGGGDGPNNAYSGTNCYATDLNALYEPYQVDGNTFEPDPILALQLITPEVDLTDYPDATFSFVDWLRVESGVLGHEFGAYVALEVLDADGDHLGWLDEEIGPGHGLDTTWQTDNTYSLDAYVGRVVKVAFNLYVNEVWTQAGWHIDDVQLTSTVPEPATLLLLSGGLCMLLRRRRR